MFSLEVSNRTEILAAGLAEWLRPPLPDPLAPEIIVVQSAGMARWLSLALADAHGVCAHADFRFPAEFIWEVLRRLSPGLPEASAWDERVLTWRVLAELDRLPAEPRYAPLAPYLGDDLGRYQLARRVAGAFTRYLIYRPDWVAHWERGGDEHWQAVLWRRLLGSQPAGAAPHRATLEALARARLRAGDPGGAADGGDAALPARVSVFGIPHLPPAHLDFFAALGARTEVRLFLFNPCREYWGDVVPERALARRGLDPARAETLYFQAGNPLLASLGRQGRDFLDAAQDVATETVESFAAPEPEADRQTLLARLQADILDLRAGDLAGVEPDDSVQVHACHGPLREVEVLYHQLLARFEADPGLRPGDVVVMAPDIEAYAPHVEAVFGTAAVPIPYAVADRPPAAESPLVAAFFRLLGLPQSRFEAGELLALLDVPALRRRFGVEAADLAQIQRGVSEAGVRWGVDEAGRGALGLPATPLHSWRAGLQRLLWGYALPAGGTALFAGTLPAGPVGDGEASLLGRFQGFCEAAFELVTSLARPRPPCAWADDLRALLVRFFAPDDEDRAAFECLLAAVAGLAADAELAGFGAPLPLAAVRRHLMQVLEPARGGGRFLSGGVTFCALLPMRSVPFKVVCLLGLDDGAFPRRDVTPGFDLMAAEPRRGDRSRRDEDRYLFLEALLSARDLLYLSYVGASPRDNAVIPPSALVSELLGVLCAGLSGPAREARLARFVTRHPLQAFSRRYFTGDPRLPCFDPALARAGRLAGRGRGVPAEFVSRPLPEPGPAWRTVSLAQLLRFYRRPAGFFLRERLGVRLAEETPAPATREPFALDGLGEWSLDQYLLRLCREAQGLPAPENFTQADFAQDAAAGGPAPGFEAAWERAVAADLLPHGAVGRATCRRRWERVTALAERLPSPDQDLPPLSLAFEVGDYRLTGRLDGLTRQGLVLHRAGRRRACDTLELWLRHLALNAALAGGAGPGAALVAVPATSRWHGLDGSVILAPVANAPVLLAELLEIYAQGLRRPLHFCPEVSLAQAASGEDAVCQKARSAWQKLLDQPGREADGYRYAFREAEVLGEEFVRLAQAVFGPLLAALGSAPATGPDRD